jgi:hypothetical protein
MKIESILKRLHGTTVDLDGFNYHFAPESGLVADPHVCEVESQAHIATLLAIAEGFRIYVPPASPDAAEPVTRTIAKPDSGANTMPVAGATGAKPPATPAPAAAGAKAATKAKSAAKTKVAAAPVEKPADTATDKPGDDDADQVREELAELDNGELEDEYERVKGVPVPEDLDRAAVIEALATHPQIEG